MNDSSAVLRIALETTSCSSLDDIVHCDVSSVIPRHCMGTDSKLSAGGGVKVGCFAMTLTAGVTALETGGVGATEGDTCIAWSREARPGDGACGKSVKEPSKLLATGDEAEPDGELNIGELRPE